MPLRAQDLPQGAQNVAGAATVHMPQPGQLRIEQASPRAVLTWNSFNLGAGAEVAIVQPDAHAVLLNRVTGAGRSQIDGHIRANGQVFLVNPNGIVIGPSGRVAAAGFVASTLDISTDDFMSGRWRFQSEADARLTHQGEISVIAGGYAALLAGHVLHEGTIRVPMGRIGLGAARRAVLDLAGDAFLQVALPSDPVKAGPGGQIQARGTLSADGGVVELRAASAYDAARHTVNLSGHIEARAVAGVSGRVVLAGGGGAVRVTGQIDASEAPVALGAPPRPRLRGGEVVITGADLALGGALIDVSGGGGGGSIRLGTAEPGVAAALRTDLDLRTRLLADGRETGAGGQVVVWSEGTLRLGAAISARGGARAEDGGTVEVFGRGALAWRGAEVDLAAPAGRAGKLWLGAPRLTVVAGADYDPNNSAHLLASVLLRQLGRSAELRLSVHGATPGGRDARLAIMTDLRTVSHLGQSLSLSSRGDIDVNGDLDMRFGQGGQLSLDAGGDLRLGGDVNLTAREGRLGLAAAGGLHLEGALRAENAWLSVASPDIRARGAVFAHGFQLETGAAWHQIAPVLPRFEATNFRLAPGSVFLRASSGDGSAARPYVLEDIYGLQGLGSAPQTSFRLGRTIDATPTRAWTQANGLNAGFAPLGGAAGFQGTLDGAGHAVVGLYQSITGGEAGLFSRLDGARVVNVRLTDALIRLHAVVGATGTAARAGLLAATAHSLDVRRPTIVDGVQVQGQLTVKGQTGLSLEVGGAFGQAADVISNRLEVAATIGVDDGGAGLFLGGVLGASGGGNRLDRLRFDGTLQVTSSGTAGGAIGGVAGTLAAQDGLWAARAIADLRVATAGAWRLGGLIGDNAGRVEQSWAELRGTSRADGGVRIGGVVGRNAAEGRLSEVRATGVWDVAGTGLSHTLSGDPFLFGGLVGENHGYITDAWARLALAGASLREAEVGGLIGRNAGRLLRGLALGRLQVTPGAAAVYAGGVAGRDVSGAQSVSAFFDIDAVGVSRTDGGLGLSAAEIAEPAAFRSWAWDWDFVQVWAPGRAGAHAPMLYALDPVLWAEAGDHTRLYGESARPLEGRLNGIGRYLFDAVGVRFDTRSLFGVLVGGRDVGRYSLSAQSEIRSSSGLSYQISVTPGLLEVRPAPLVIHGAVMASDLGALALNGPVWSKVEGLRYNDQITGLSWASLGAQLGAEPGLYPLDIWGAQIGSEAGDVTQNYEIHYIPGTLQRRAAPIPPPTSARGWEPAPQLAAFLPATLQAGAAEVATNQAQAFDPEPLEAAFDAVGFEWVACRAHMREARCRARAFVAYMAALDAHREAEGEARAGLAALRAVLAQPGLESAAAAFAALEDTGGTAARLAARVLTVLRAARG